MTFRVLFVTLHEPSSQGPGAYHRTYQILHQLTALAGESSVTLLSPKKWRLAHFGPDSSAADVYGRTSLVQRLRNRAARAKENPYKLVTPAGFSTRGAVARGFVAGYQQLVDQGSDPVVSVVAHTMFDELVEINRAHNVPTILCPHNLDSLTANLPFSSLSERHGDGRARNLRRKLQVQAAMTDLANELRVLASVQHRLFTSRVEAGFVGGLGLASSHYPYMPVGAIRERLQNTRRLRATAATSRDEFVLLGSATHPPTRDSLLWFLRCAENNGFPANIRLTLVGPGTEALRSPLVSRGLVEALGWLDQEKLDALLARARAVLIPHRLGFGALTRMSECACAGIPCIVSEHAGYALSNVPGSRIVEDSWQEWRSAMDEVRDSPHVVGEAEYLRWEASQPQPLAAAVQGLLNSHGRPRTAL